MLGIIIVTYKSYNRIRDYVKEDLLGFVSSEQGKIVVVDVGSEYSSTERIANLLDVRVSSFDKEPVGDVIVLHVEENLGYARANNFGVRYLLKYFPKTDTFLFSNEDVRFKSPNVLETLLAKLKSLPETGAIGPEISDMNGHIQGHCYVKPNVWHYIFSNIFEPLFGAGLVNSCLGSPKNSAYHEDKSGYVYSLNGCFFIVKAKDFLEAGMFDERTLLYWEENILASRMAAIGKRQYCESSVQVQHLIGGTMLMKDHPNTFLTKNKIYGALLYFAEYEKVVFYKKLLLKISNGIRLIFVYLAILKYNVKQILRKKLCDDAS